MPVIACRYQEMVQQKESSDRYLDNEAQTLPGLSKTKETQSNTLSTVSTAVQVMPHARSVPCWQPGLAAGQGCEQPSGCAQLQYPPLAASPAADGSPQQGPGSCKESRLPKLRGPESLLPAAGAPVGHP